MYKSSDKRYTLPMKNAEASVRMEGCQVTPQMREQCQRVLRGEVTTAELLRANHLRLPRIAHLMAILRDRDGLDVTPVGTIGAARRELLRLLKQEELL